MPSTTYDHLIATLGRAKAELETAISISRELARDKCLTGECRNLAQVKADIAYAELLVRDRARCNA